MERSKISQSVILERIGEYSSMNRVCTTCGVQVGNPHKRKLAYIWKRKPRNIIQDKAEVIAKLKELSLRKN